MTKVFIETTALIIFESNSKSRVLFLNMHISTPVLDHSITLHDSAIGI